ncbi:MAG TPA: hypothetical protein VFT87_01745 [Candidatus Saccharimonadales bacterium]|nr:hypothetical protein [Candidatus Saccharimonadales bacterium]
MTHRTRVDAATFLLVKNGQRIIEPRLYDPAHRAVRVGDLLLFEQRDTNEELVAKVVGLLRFGSFKELFNAYPTERFGKSEEELLGDMHKFYTLDQELQHGVVGIKMHILKGPQAKNA